MFFCTRNQFALILQLSLFFRFAFWQTMEISGNLSFHNVCDASDMHEQNTLNHLRFVCTIHMCCTVCRRCPLLNWMRQFSSLHARPVWIHHHVWIIHYYYSRSRAVGLAAKNWIFPPIMLHIQIGLILFNAHLCNSFAAYQHTWACIIIASKSKAQKNEMKWNIRCGRMNKHNPLERRCGRLRRRDSSLLACVWKAVNSFDRQRNYAIIRPGQHNSNTWYGMYSANERKMQIKLYSQRCTRSLSALVVPSLCYIH